MAGEGDQGESAAGVGGATGEVEAGDVFVAVGGTEECVFYAVSADAVNAPLMGVVSVAQINGCDAAFDALTGCGDPTMGRKAVSAYLETKGI